MFLGRYFADMHLKNPIRNWFFIVFYVKNLWNHIKHQRHRKDTLQMPISRWASVSSWSHQTDRRRLVLARQLATRTRAQACTRCKARKAKCSIFRPCSRCTQLQQNCFDGGLSNGQNLHVDLGEASNKPYSVVNGQQRLPMLYSDALVSSHFTGPQPSIHSDNEEAFGPFSGNNFNTMTQSSHAASLPALESTPAAGGHCWNKCESRELWAWEAAAGPGEEDPFKEDWAAWVSDSHQTSTV